MIKFRAGYVAVVGLPNSGKSSLINALLGQKLNIVSDKPQTTRKKILGIITKHDYQIIFIDTPGILEPNYLLQEKMMDAVENSAQNADLILMLQDVAEDYDGTKFFQHKFVAEVLLKLVCPKILLLNKIDLSDQKKVMKLIELQNQKKLYDKVIPISAINNFNLTEIINSVVELLPEHPKYFPEDDLTNESERFFVSEIIREKILNQYSEEVPYSCEVIISEFKEREDNKDFIEALIVVEKDTQKAIIIGKEGKAIKKLGEAARISIEEFLDREIFLSLRVKVKPKWRRDENLLKIYGYN